MIQIFKRLLCQIGFDKSANEPRHKGAVVWLTGLSSSGKSTIAQALERRLRADGYRVERLDGDQIRAVFPATGFTSDARDEHIRRVGFMAHLLEKHGVVVITSLVSPYRKSRAAVRELCQNFFEVYLSTPLEACEKRDVKGLYAKARRGEIANFTGISDPYETPGNPEIIIDTSKLSVEACVETIESALRRIL